MPDKKRGGTSEQAREYRQRGHDDAKEFAGLLGMDEYKNDKKAKKDVIDPSGDAHSVKSGEKKWQIFLYARKRFEADDGFQALNGVGSLLIHCIDAFPPDYQSYKKNESQSKERLRTPMRELKDRFQRKALLRAFLMKSIFNGGEVDYLTVKQNGIFHVYHNTDVIRVMGEKLTVENSRQTSAKSTPEQKVLFKYDGNNLGELEMRNDSLQHYGEVRFNMIKAQCVKLLSDSIPESKRHSDRIFSYGKARTVFWRW